MFPPGWCELGRMWGTARGRASAPMGRGQHGSSPSSEPAQEPLQQARDERCGTIPVCSRALGAGEVPPFSPNPNGAISTAALWVYVKTLCMGPCNDFRREVHLIFIRCSRLWFYKLMEHVSAKAPKQSCCLQKLLADVLLSETCVENLCSTLCFVPPEITRFLLHWIITSYLIEMRPDQNKAGPLKGLQRGGHLPCKNCTRVWWIGHFQSFFRCIKKKIGAIKLTTELLFPVFKTIIAHDVWVTNTS